MQEVELYNTDCYQILPKLIEQNVKVDLILTDPPYKIQTTNSQRCNNEITKRVKKITEKLKFVKDGFDYKALIPLLLQLQDIPNMVFFCCNDQVGELQTFLASFNLNVEICVWNKYNAIPICNYHLMNDLEYILVARGAGAYFNNNLPPTMKRRVFTEKLVQNSKDYHKEHPCEKPLKILDNLIQLYSKENATVLDCFMGSGTTGISAVKNKRNFIGIELLENYFNISKQRIEAENRQVKLF